MCYTTIKHCSKEASPMKDTFLIVDGNSLMHRAFHALPLMDAGGT